MKTGLFWQQEAVAPKKPKMRPMPPIPDTGWQRPQYFPDLSGAKAIAIDVETYDPDLTEYGPGWARGVGHIVGVSIATDDGFRGYYPMRHEVEPEWNFDPKLVLRWLADNLCNPNQPKVGANLTYDIGWLTHEGVNVKGIPMDVQYAEALLDESARVALEVLGQKYCYEGKESMVMYQWCADFYGGAVDHSQRKNIYRCPPRLVGHYAESDTDLPIRIMELQYPLLVEEGLLEVFMMECELIYLMIAMRFEGVKVDVDKAEQIRVELLDDIALKQSHLNSLAGFEVNVNANASLAKLFDNEGIRYPMTAPSTNYPQGQPSFTGKFLEGVKHPCAQLINEIKHAEKFNGTFIESYILNSNINGRLYGQFHQLRGDGGGTRSGRLSSSNPNLQNIPSRDKIWGPKIRGLFIPNDGHIAWRKYDYSQIEYRMLAHFAVGLGADDIRSKFTDNPYTDYHQAVIDLVKHKTGILLDRKPAKNINFGLLYGMGKFTLAENLGLGKQEAEQLFEAYHIGVPFAQATMDKYSKQASETGEVKTIMGRKSRFDRWEEIGGKHGQPTLKMESALRQFGTNIQRAKCYKAVNRLLQGSAADMMKMAMLKCWKEGIFDDTGIPSLTVHDELNFSDAGGRDYAFLAMKEAMETCIPLKVPVIVDGEIGPDWGHVKDIPS